MSDARLRAIERSLRGGGDVTAEARLLRERARVGRLRRRDLALAAYCGDPAARLALGGAAPEPPLELDAWLLGLEGWRNDALVRALAGAAAAYLDGYEELRPDDPRPRRCVRAALAWCECRCHPCAEAALAAGDDCRAAILELQDPEVEDAARVLAGPPALLGHDAALAAFLAQVTHRGRGPQVGQLHRLLRRWAAPRAVGARRVDHRTLPEPAALRSAAARALAGHALRVA